MIKRLLSLIGFCLLGATLLIFWVWPQLEIEFQQKTSEISERATQVVLGEQDLALTSTNLAAPASPSALATLSRVKRVIDGDTIELEDGRKVRYIGINTPETKHPARGVECFGLEASQRNKELVEGKVVSLEKDVSETDRYGRLLRYVWVEGILVNQVLVTEGFAWASRYPPDTVRQIEFQRAQVEAEATKLGLWQNCPPL